MLRWNGVLRFTRDEARRIAVTNRLRGRELPSGATPLPLKRL